MNEREVFLDSIHKDTLDSAYLRRWAKDLGVTELLEDLLAGRIKPKSS